tara:strand:+ start:126 stop:1151 length:1026 start_codon:yes stop_codon:yes gene_type:complete
MKYNNEMMIGGRLPMTCEQININDFSRKKESTKKLARETKCNCRSNHPKLPCTSVYTDDGKWVSCSTGSKKDTKKKKPAEKYTTNPLFHSARSDFLSISGKENANRDFDIKMTQKRNTAIKTLNTLNERIKKVQEREIRIQEQIKNKHDDFKDQTKMVIENQIINRRMDSELKKIKKNISDAKEELKHIDDTRHEKRKEYEDLEKEALQRLRNASATQKQLGARLDSLKKKQEDAAENLKRTLNKLKSAERKVADRMVDGVSQTELTSVSNSLREVTSPPKQIINVKKSETSLVSKTPKSVNHKDAKTTKKDPAIANPGLSGSYWQMNKGRRKPKPNTRWK